MEQREGIVVNPEERLSTQQVCLIDTLSREILEEIGLVCYSERAAAIYKEAGCPVSERNGVAVVTIPSDRLDAALATVPSTVILGARNPENRLVLKADEPRVRFGSGSETNVWLDIGFENGSPVYTRKPGSIELLGKAAHLANRLENLDFFIRCVNIQDPEIEKTNKDVNTFFTALNNIGKHVQAGLTDLGALDDVVFMGEVVAGSRNDFLNNPPISFITCLIKSPLQIVKDTAEKFIEITSRRIPLVLSSSPMGGATAPFDEMGMVAQINAELLAGITLSQLVAPGAPILYGAVPVRVRLDNINDMYGAPEYLHYNIDCAQMARHYGVPCYSAAGVADADRPGIQATAEKMASFSVVPKAGAQYIHYAFGLLERTNVFCPEQAIIDDAHLKLIKYGLRQPDVTDEKKREVKELIREVLASGHKTYVYNLPLPTLDDVYIKYPLETPDGDVLHAAHLRYQEIDGMHRDPLPNEVRRDILTKVPGILQKK